MANTGIPASHVDRRDAGTARAFDAAAAVLDIATGGFTSGLLIVEMDDRTGAITMTPTLSQGANVGASSVYQGAAYTPPDGAFTALSADGIQQRRVELFGDILRATLTFGGANGTCTSRVSLVCKQGDVHP